MKCVGVYSLNRYNYGMGQEYRHTKTTVSLINYHFVFCPRYRRKVLVGQVESRFKELASEICAQNDWLILAMEIYAGSCSFVSQLSLDRFAFQNYGDDQGDHIQATA